MTNFKIEPQKALVNGKKASMILVLERRKIKTMVKEIVDQLLITGQKKKRKYVRRVKPMETPVAPELTGEAPLA